MDINTFLKRRPGDGDAFCVGDKIYGVFYRNKTVHIAEFVPYNTPPTRALCGHREYGLWTSFSMKSLDISGSKKCEACFKAIEEIAGG